MAHHCPNSIDPCRRWLVGLQYLAALSRLHVVAAGQHATRRRAFLQRRIRLVDRSWKLTDTRAPRGHLLVGGWNSTRSSGHVSRQSRRSAASIRFRSWIRSEPHCTIPRKFHRSGIRAWAGRRAAPTYTQALHLRTRCNNKRNRYDLVSNRRAVEEHLVNAVNYKRTGSGGRQRSPPSDG